MGVDLKSKYKSYEIGSSDFFISFFDTVEVRLTRGLFSKKYPAILKELYSGELPFEKLEKAEKELKEIHQKLKRFPPSKVVWDKHDRSKQPPWGKNLAPEITDLSNYFVTSDGKDLFEVIFEAIEQAKAERSNLIIE